MSLRTTARAGGIAATLSTFLGLALTSGPAFAAPDKQAVSVGADASTTLEPETAAGAEAAPAATESAPAPVQLEELPAAAEPPKPPLFVFYGIIKPEIITSFRGVETFGKTTLVAPTAAANPISDPNADLASLSFQIQQTRFGLKIGEGGPLQGRLEIDFVDPTFSVSSPIQATRPRLRLAYFTYKPAEKHTLVIGQNWDIFSPLNPLTMNIVGASFQAGNSAFLRPQAIYTYGSGQGIEVSGAIGLRAQNTGPALNTLEYGAVPSFAVQAGYRQGKTWFGASAIISAEATTITPERNYATTFAANLFANLQLSDSISLIAEAYIGKNTNALGLLTLGTGALTTDVGGYVSANFKFHKMHSLWVLAGVAGVLNGQQMAVGYTPAAAGPPPVAAARLGIGGIYSNMNFRATYVLTAMEGLQFYVEPYLFITNHKIAAVDNPAGISTMRIAPGNQLGAKYTF